MPDFAIFPVFSMGLCLATALDARRQRKGFGNLLPDCHSLGRKLCKGQPGLARKRRSPLRGRRLCCANILYFNILGLRLGRHGAL
jgi:hypothetical protein